MPYIWLLLCCLIYYVIAGITVSVGYHRSLTHKAVTFVPWLEKCLVTLALPAGTPIQWVGNHRHHHQYTDVPGDPHSPVIDGFWYAHVGWYIDSKNPIVCFMYSIAGPLRTVFDAFYRPQTNQQYIGLAKDISQSKYYALISRPLYYALIVLTETISIFGLAYVAFGILGIVSFWITLVLIYNLGDSVDSIAHLFGQSHGEAKHQARNNVFVGIFAAGEWHGNHHTFPQSAKHGLGKGQLDLGWIAILFFQRLNLVTNINIPAQGDINRMFQQ